MILIYSNFVKVKYVNLFWIIILLMSEGKYQTLDPLILETLNLNERRMNHILDILHGREPKEYPKTDRRPHKSISKNKTIATFTQDDSILPPITISNRKRKQKDDTKEPQK